MQAPGQVQRGSGEGSEGSREGLGFGAETGQQQQGSGNPEKVPGSPGAKPSQDQQGSGAGSRKGCGESQVTFNRDPEKVWEALVHSQVRFNRVPENVPVKVWEAYLVLSQVRFNRVPEKVPEKVWEALVQVCELCVQSQVRFNRGLEKVPEKVLGSLGAKPSQVQRVWEKVAEKVPEKVMGIFGAGPGHIPTGSKGFQCLVSQHASERFVKTKRRGCWGYH